MHADDIDAAAAIDAAGLCVWDAGTDVVMVVLAYPYLTLIMEALFDLFVVDRTQEGSCRISLGRGMSRWPDAAQVGDASVLVVENVLVHLIDDDANELALVEAEARKSAPSNLLGGAAPGHDEDDLICMVGENSAIDHRKQWWGVDDDEIKL